MSVKSFELFGKNPLESFPDIFPDTEKLRAEVEQSHLVEPFLDFLQEKYGAERVTTNLGNNPQDTLLKKVSKFSFGNVVNAVEELIPGFDKVNEIISTVKNSIFSLFSDDMSVLIDEYVRKRKTGSANKVAEWMRSQGIKINSVTDSVSESDPLDSLKDPLVQDILKENNIALVGETLGSLEKEVHNIEKIYHEGKCILEVEGKTPYFNAVALADLLLLSKEFYDDTGSALTINSTYRTSSHQQDLYDGYKQGKPGYNLAAAPGESNHNLGLAFDVSKDSKTRKSLARFQALAQKHHFSGISSEDWHFNHSYVARISDSVALSQVIEDAYITKYSAVA